MMGVAVIALAIALAGAIVAIVALALGRVSDTKEASKQITDERVAHTKTNGELERVRFELRVTADKLAHAEDTIEVLAKETPDANPNADLPPDAVRARAVRAAIKAKAAAARRAGEVPAGAGEPMHPSEAAGAASSTEVLPVGSLDPNEPLL